MQEDFWCAIEALQVALLSEEPMRVLLIAFAFLVSTMAYAQPAPPMVGGKPLVQIKPKIATPVRSLIERLRVCLEIADQTKERLDCYDAVVAPQPKPSALPAKVVTDCKFLKEEDARLNCFNSFLEKRIVQRGSATKPSGLPKPVPNYVPSFSSKPHYVRRGRGGCGSRGGAGYRLPNGRCAGRHR